MSCTAGPGRRFASRLGLIAAVLLPACAGASSAQALDNGIATNFGELRVKVGPGATSFQYQLRYDVEGFITHAHLQLGEPGASRGMAVWLCGTQANPGPSGTPACPGARAGAVSGTVSAANVVGPAGTGVGRDQFGALVEAMRAGMTQARVHTTKHPKGEIMGRLK